MRKFNLEQLVRSIVQDELEKAFSASSAGPIESEEITNTENDNEEIILPTLNRTPVQARGKAKNRGRGRVTKSTDGRLRANKK